MRNRFIRCAVVAMSVVALSAPTAALADRPGPGDKQCTPGQNGSPKPGHKAGACRNQRP